MATVTVVPDGDGTTLQLTPLGAGTHFSEVDEGIAGADDGTTTLSTTANSTQSDFLELEDMPADFDTSIDVQAIERTQVAGIVDDSVQMRVHTFESNEITLTVGTVIRASGNHSWATTTGSAASSVGSKATWDTRKVRLQNSRSNSGMPDSITAEFTAVELVINYNTTGPGAEELMAARQVGGEQPFLEPAEVVAY